ncbi:MAG TPA: hypothetical protein VH374_10820 [Polyangia bacterium]|jgi:hypothetical protein|nr:hypothetical protein [Polyangia bacterium]
MVHRRIERLIVACALISGTAILACGVGIQRDLSAIPPGQIGFDDLCGLQGYFDALEVKAAKPPMLVSAVELENDAKHPVHGGKALMAFSGDFQLKNLRRVLHENWKRLPDEVTTAKKIELEVSWTEKAGVRRVVTERDAEMIINRKLFYLPYHVCLSELLYGEPLYRQRREMLGLPLPPAPLPDGGAVSDGSGH